MTTPTYLFTQSNLVSMPISEMYISKSDIRSEKYYKEEAIEIFGEALANSLQIRDGSWESVIASKNLFLITYRIIQDCSKQLHSLPTELEYTIQSIRGIIFEYRPVSNPYDGFLGHLITPYGTIEIVFKENPEKFMHSYSKFFIHQLQAHYPRYSLTPHAQDMAVLKNPSRRFLYEIKFEDQLPKEMLPHEYSRTEVEEICTALHAKHPYLNITPKRYLLRGISGEWL